VRLVLSPTKLNGIRGREPQDAFQNSAWTASNFTATLVLGGEADLRAERQQYKLTTIPEAEMGYS